MARKRQTPQLKIYAGTIDGRFERVVAARSKKEAMCSLRVGRETFLKRFRVTCLEDYEEVCKNPCTVYRRPLWGVEGDPFIPEGEEGEKDQWPSSGTGNSNNR